MMMTDDLTPPFEDPEDDIIYVSKSEMKREAQRMHDLGQKLSELNPNRWSELPISEELHRALKENNRLTSMEAKRRHLNFIAKLIWHEKLEEIHAALDLLDPSSESYGRIQKQLEQWRERLVTDPQALNEFIDNYPQVDRQQLRNLIRNAQKEVASKAPSSHYKKLFQLLKLYVS